MVTEAEKKRVGALIRRRRQALDLDQEDLARLVGVSRNAVSKWETGQSYPSKREGKIEAVLAPFSLAPQEDPERDRAELHDSIDRMDAAELGRLVEAYRRIKQNGASTRRDRAG